MKKSNITGWKDVFSFTLTQTLKNKAYRISFLLMFVIAVAAIPLASKFLLNNETAAEGIGEIKKVYVLNNTAFSGVDFTKVSEQEGMGGLVFQMAEGTYDKMLDKIENEENTSVVLNMTEENGMYSLSFVKASKGKVSNADMRFLAAAVQDYFDEYKMETLGITAEQLSLIEAQAELKVYVAAVTGEEIIEVDDSISQGEYWFVYGILFIVLMVNVLASSQIATSVVSDKSSKVLEYLLTSIKPIAILIGKILAMLSAVLIQVIAIILGVFVSNKVTTELFSDGNSVLADLLPKNLFSNLNILNILFCLLLVAIGMIFYAVLAGLAGATVSRIEEASESLTLFTIVNMIGAYIGIGAAGTMVAGGQNAFVYFAYLFPLSSPFILPGAVLLGKANLLFVVGAIILEILVAVLLLKFVTKVYQTLILHNGNKIGLKELFKISKAE